MKAELALNVDSLVDKLAEKIGMASEKLLPLAEETVSQYQAKAVVGICQAGAMILFGILCGAVALFLFHRIFKLEKENRLDDGANSIFSVCGVIVTSVFFFIFTLYGGSNLFDSASEYVSPLVHILGIK